MSNSILETHIDDCILWKNNRSKAKFKQKIEDFVVFENLDWQFSGEGEHLFLQIEKINCNTVWVAKKLAKFYKIPPRDVGYSGLKDKLAKTTQYFSLRIPGIKIGQYDLIKDDEFRVISHNIHNKKLKRGNHKSNYFEILLRDIENLDIDFIDLKISWLKTNGSPNFFDGQRFGYDNSNLKKVDDWAKGKIDVRKRNEISMLLSALRSSAFNEILAYRITANNWNKAVLGDVMNLNGSRSNFLLTELDDKIYSRVAEQDIHPTAAMLGDGELQTAMSVKILEQDVLFKYINEYKDLIMKNKLTQDRRALRIKLNIFNYEIIDDNVLLKFDLPSGSYASGLVKQLFDI